MSYQNVKSIKKILCLISCFLIFPALAVDVEGPYAEPDTFGWLTRTPSNMWEMGAAVVDEENRAALLGIGLSTALLLIYDQEIVDESQRFAKASGLLGKDENGRETHTTTLFSIRNFSKHLAKASILLKVLNIR